jgi:hypothetical protein
LLRRLGATVVTAELAGDFDVIVEGVGGATFGLAIEHLAPRVTARDGLSGFAAPAAPGPEN